MNRIPKLALGSLALLCIAFPVRGDGPSQIDYPSHDARRAALRRPAQAAVLPEALRLGSDGDRTAAREAPRASRAAASRPAHGDRPSNWAETDRQAHAAAVWTARELAHGVGRRSYYRVGLYDGLQTSMTDPGLGRWEYLEGRRHAWADPGARSAGLDLGRSAAEQVAAADAERQVAAQFRNLVAEPVFRPRPGRPAYAPSRPDVAPPLLADVFAAFPLRSFAPFRERWEPFLRGWRFDGWALYQCDGWTEFHDAAWADPARALGFWLEDERRSARYRELRIPALRQRFAAVFEDEFAKLLAGRFGPALVQAYELGFTDGWSYGAFVREEWDYRRGFHAGWGQAVTDAAVGAFHEFYPERYRSVYRTIFDDWSFQAKPEIAEFRLHDGNDDGVFEPGESLFVEYELINFGGAEGRFGLALDGRELAAGGRDTVVLPARSVQRGRGLEARISELARPRTRSEVTLSLAGLSRRLPLEVSRPLELVPDGSRTRRDNLAGEVRLEVTVRNVSRRPRGARLSLTTRELPGFAADRELHALAPGESESVQFTVAGLAPLALIAGAVVLDVAVESDGVPQDRLSRRLPETATDLGSNDLPALLLRMASDATAPVADRELARELLLLRLREDWRAAVRASGNPYKADYKSGGRRTALGELVRTWQLERRGMTRPDVFAGLSDDVYALSRDLPGAHPLLRKYVRRLAGQLP